MSTKCAVDERTKGDTGKVIQMRNSTDDVASASSLSLIFIEQLKDKIIQRGPWWLTSFWLWQADAPPPETWLGARAGQEFPFPGSADVPYALWSSGAGLNPADDEQSCQGLVLTFPLDDTAPHNHANPSQIDPRHGPGGSSARIHDYLSLALHNAEGPDAPPKAMPENVLSEIAKTALPHVRALLWGSKSNSNLHALPQRPEWTILPDRRILWRTSAAAAFGLSFWPSQKKPGRIAFDDKESQARFEVAIKHVMEMQVWADHAVLVLGVGPNGLQISRLSLRRASVLGEASSARVPWLRVTAELPDLDTPVASAKFQVLGLTAPEVMLAAELFNGGTVRSYAQSRKISHETARTQTKRLMSRLNVRKQSQLIRLLSFVAR